MDISRKNEKIRDRDLVRVWGDCGGSDALRMEIVIL
jgi:hypothetical protein